MNETQVPEVALLISMASSLARLAGLGPRPTLAQCYQRLGCPGDILDDADRDRPVTRLHLGNEFCDGLILSPRHLKQAQVQARAQELALTLVTPMLTDAGLVRLELLLSELTPGSEVVVNDWGALQALRADYPHLTPVLGRMLNKMIKDPRLPSAAWTKLHPHNSRPGHLQAFLRRFNIGHLEMDAPPFARPEQFHADPLTLSVHLPYGYTVKGRMCRIGSVAQKDDDKFAAAHACGRECLDYWVDARRAGTTSPAELYSFQRGNTQFYRHSQDMTAALRQAMAQQWIQRLIFAGDWHENHLPAQ